jgi:pilus assembly protein CpaB
MSSRLMLSSFLPFAVSGWLALAPANRLHAEPAAEVVTVLVAKRDLPIGLKLDEPEKLFKKVRYVKGDEPKDAVTDFAKLMGKYLTRSLTEDQPIKESWLTASDPVALKLPKGMRALAIKVEQDAAVGGFILPGSKVDVIHTTKVKGEAKSKTIVQNLQVLAVDTQVRGEKDAKTVPLVVTLAVTAADAEKLAAAQKEGKLTLTLRKPGEDK